MSGVEVTHEGHASHACKHCGKSLCFIQRCKASLCRCYKPGGPLDRLAGGTLR